MNAVFFDLKKKLRPRGGGFALSEWKFAFLLAAIVFSSDLMAQSSSKKSRKESSQRKLDTTIPKSEIKLKSFEEYQQFVIADFRDRLIDEINPDDEEYSLQKDFQSRLPLHTVFKTTSSKVCIIGVEGTADAKMVLSLVNNKRAKIIKKADLDKTLSISNVKIVTKE